VLREADSARSIAGRSVNSGYSATAGVKREWRIALARDEKREALVLITIFIFLLALWLLGMISSYTLGGYIHLLLIIAIVVLLIRIIQGRNPL